MKKLFFILALCFSAFASAQCPAVNLPQNAKWKFNFSQCFGDTNTYTYVEASRVAYFDANKNLVYITYAQLADSLNVGSPGGNQWNIQYKDGGDFQGSTDFNFNATEGVFYIYDFNGDTLFSVNTQTRETKSFGTFTDATTYPDSSVLFVGSDGKPTTDSARLFYSGSGELFLQSGPLQNFSANINNGFRVAGGSASNSQFYSAASGAASSTSAAYNLRFYRARGSLLSPLAVVADNYIGRISFIGFTDTIPSSGELSIRVQSKGILDRGGNCPFEYSITRTSSGITTVPFLIDTSNRTTLIEAAILQTPANSDLTDSLISKDDTTGQMKAWRPMKEIAIKNDSNTVGDLIINGNLTITSKSAVSGNLVLFQNSTPTAAYTITNTRQHVMASGLGSFILNTTGSGPIFDFDINSSGSVTQFIRYGAGTVMTSSTVNQSLMVFSGGFSASSGSPYKASIDINNTINLSGTYSGTAYGVWVHPTITAAPDYRALQIDRGKVFFPIGSGAGSGGSPWIPASASTNDSILVVDASTGQVEHIAQPLAGSATLDFPNTNANEQADLTITVTGAADGDVVSLGAPNAAMTQGTYMAWVSASNTVTVRFHNTAGGAIDPASGTFKVKVLR